MRNHYEKALRTLERFLSPATARALLTRALKEQGVSASQLSAADLMRMSTGLRRGVRLFVDGAQWEDADREIARLCGGRVELPDPVSLTIDHERDVGRVRSEARRICTSCGATPFSMQKVATVVSELARNIVLYAGTGELSITPQRRTNGAPANAKTSVLVCASDEGPGIPNIDTILSGNYRSKTGLGKGLLGTKRLAETFDVTTSSGGTTITAEIIL
jgi:serine/threonine-protein kinase RsbT